MLLNLLFGEMNNDEISKTFGLVPIRRIFWSHRIGRCVRKAQRNMEFVFQLSIYGRAEGNVENLDRICFKTNFELDRSLFW